MKSLKAVHLADQILADFGNGKPDLPTSVRRFEDLLDQADEIMDHEEWRELEQKLQQHPKWDRRNSSR